MTGLIWLVQLVHYPAFRFVDAPQFAEFHAFHSTRITWIVLPVMTFEFVSAFLLAYRTNETMWIANAIAVVLIWLATALLSVPTHNQLAIGKSDELIYRLARTNWPRTIIWSLRSCAFLVFVIREGHFS